LYDCLNTISQKVKEWF